MSCVGHKVQRQK